MIKPTIGRRVWYRPSNLDRGLASAGKPPHILQEDFEQPCDAGIVYVHGDRCINISITDHYGKMHSRNRVQLLQDGDAVPPGGGYAEWMPYQVKADAERNQGVSERNLEKEYALDSKSVSAAIFTGKLTSGSITDIDPYVIRPPANKVTPGRIQMLKDRVIYHTAPRLGNLTSTFVHAYLHGKFYLATGHSACVDPANYDEKKGYDIAFRNAEAAAVQKLWELEGYTLYNNLQ